MRCLRYGYSCNGYNCREQRSSEYQLYSERSTMYLGQTPQSFKAKKLRDIYLNMTEEEKEILTGCLQDHGAQGRAGSSWWKVM